MNANVQIFKNNRFGEVRVTEIDGKTYFVGIDVIECSKFSKKASLNTNCADFFERMRKRWLKRQKKYKYKYI
jgi:prophage antirepressor-like protein